MLTHNEVLDYIKTGLGWPFMHLELEDEKIIEYITEHTLKDFQYYVPQVWKTTLNTEITANKVPGLQNEFYIFDPQGMNIFNVIEIYTSSSDLIINGHPIMGPMSVGEIPEFALAVETAGMLKMFSNFDITFEFKHPNIIRISPVRSNFGVVTIEYEREQPQDLSGIPNDLGQYFKRLALADIMIVLGRIRKRYSGNLRTPFGDIPLEADVLDEGKELRREVIEILEKAWIPNVRCDHG